MTDYSQYGEQAHILEKLKDVKNGRLLDIGAWHPTTFSNSRALIEAGWSAVLVEPSPGPMHTLLKEYGNNERVELIQAAMSTYPENSLARLYITDDALSTTEPQAYQQWKEKGGYFGTLLVPTFPIAQILWEYGPFDFVNIDTEGTSGTLLRQMIAETPSDAAPSCICVEHDGHADRLSTIGEYRGYKSKDLGINLLLWR